MAGADDKQRVRIGIVGINGHGRWHLDNVARLSDAGVARLAAVCDRAAIGEDVRAICADRGAQIFESYDAMLASADLDVVVIATPPHVHGVIACAAMEAGVDVLLEKPPTVRLADLDAVVATAARTGRLCQVGFQSLGSAAFDAARDALRSGVLGDVLDVSAAGAWIRRPSYFSRAPWSGRRFAEGVAVGDGAIANPFAHALMNCLAIATADGGSAVGDITAELFHANAIESDDTSALRVRLDNGRQIVLAVTLCADQLVDPYLLVHGSAADLIWSYQADSLQLRPRGKPSQAIPSGANTDLLMDLIAVRSGAGHLRCPVDDCREFTAISESLLDAASVRRIPAAYAVREPDDPDAPVVVPGITALVQSAAAQRALFSELAVPWAAAL